MKSILALIGSTRAQSSNLKLVQYLQQQSMNAFQWTFFDGLDQLPHFNPDLDQEPLPPSIYELRRQINQHDIVLICTPEYVFSIPGSLKNALEWCVSTTLFSKKQVALITASSSGAQAHEQLKMIIKVLGGVVDENSALLISGIKSKMNSEGDVIDETARKDLEQLLISLVRV
jgi:chromate reductase, NAD(P)H dehydrogenase (quinone)